MAGFQYSRDADVGGMQNVTEGEGSDTGMAEPDERTAEIQRLQEEVWMLQEAVGNIGVEVQWVAQGGESRAQNLQMGDGGCLGRGQGASGIGKGANGDNRRSAGYGGGVGAECGSNGWCMA